MWGKKRKRNLDSHRYEDKHVSLISSPEVVPCYSVGCSVCLLLVELEKVELEG